MKANNSFCFQAEDGIRDIGVTGVQTCALPICAAEVKFAAAVGCDHTIDARSRTEEKGRDLSWSAPLCTQQQDVEREQIAKACLTKFAHHLFLKIHRDLDYGFSWQIGRASCRERV